MHTLVLLKMVPDVVEELDVAPGGKSLSTEFLRMIVSESDEHALEEALILKERHGGKVTVLALDAPEVDDALFTALAKGADRALKIVDAETGGSTGAACKAVADVLANDHGLMPADLILTGTQAIDDLDGLAAPLLSHYLGWPFIGIVTAVAVSPSGNAATVTREFPNSVRGEFELPLPAVLGVQAAERPPRYVPVAKVRAAMKTQSIVPVPVATLAEGGPAMLDVCGMSKPEPASHAVMLEGSADDVSGRLCGILRERGLL
jgi:electron transfer flavoprotein beta subunit